MRLGLFLPVALLAGCETLTPQRGEMIVAPVPFPTRGIYTGTTIGGAVTMLFRADGRGLSCERGLGARLFLGDIIFTGERVHMEIGSPLRAVRLSKDELVIEIGGTDQPLQMRRVSEAPTVCRDFFEKYR